jgi:hypothetical protein
MRRTLEVIAVCGDNPDRVTGCVEPTDGQACQRCSAIAVGT